jgi:hypothetical protein
MWLWTATKQSTAPAAPGILIGANIMHRPTITLKEAAMIAKQFGLVKGKGTYNGAPFWIRPGQSAIITREQLAEMAVVV